MKTNPVINQSSSTPSSLSDGTDTQAWYAIEYSDAGANDWYQLCETYDTIRSAALKCAELVRQDRKTRPFDFRIVRKTLDTTVIPGWQEMTL